MGPAKDSVGGFSWTLEMHPFSKIFVDNISPPCLLIESNYWHEGGIHNHVEYTSPESLLLVVGARAIFLIKLATKNFILQVKKDTTLELLWEKCESWNFDCSKWFYLNNLSPSIVPIFMFIGGAWKPINKPSWKWEILLEAQILIWVELLLMTIITYILSNLFLPQKFQCLKSIV